MTFLLFLYILTSIEEYSFTFLRSTLLKSHDWELKPQTLIQECFSNASFNFLPGLTMTVLYDVHSGDDVKPGPLGILLTLQCELPQSH